MSAATRLPGAPRRGVATTGGAPSVRMGSVIALAWPSVLSFVLHNGFRINDQFCVQELGPSAQAALGSSIFVMIMNFAVYFLVMGGTLPLVARATGAGDPERRDAVIVHALLAATGVGLVLTLLGGLFAGHLVALLNLEGDVALLATEYLRAIYLGSLALSLVPVVDASFVAMGDTRIPLAMQVISVSSNFALNMALIYGSSKFAWLPFEGLGMTGAAVATVISRGFAAAFGLALLGRRHGVRIWRRMPLSLEHFRALIRIGAPNALSIATYAAVYWLLLAVVVSHLGRSVMAGLSIGFNVFEGVSFPFFLGVAMAGSSLIGRSLGAGDPARAREAVRVVRRLTSVCGIAFALVFWFASPWIASLFSDDPAVLEETVRYARILAFSQFFVAHETAGEKALWGAGHTRPIFMVSVPGNLLRIPLAWLFALGLGGGAAGVWWAINVTSVLKASVLFLIVRYSRWAEGPSPADSPSSARGVERFDEVGDEVGGVLDAGGDPHQSGA